MITSLTLLEKKTECEQFLTVIRKYAARYTDEMWTFLTFQKVSEAEKLLNSQPILDLVNWDVTIEGAQAALEKMRRWNENAFLMIVADTSVSPMTYLKPGISPGALLLKPINPVNTERVMRDLFEVWIRKFNHGQTDSFLVETREERQYIPLAQIDYFEAKEKKVFVRTKSSEYGFYDTLDTLESRLPAEFMRCHRSYIVNLKRIRTLMLSQNLIQLIDGVEVPFSRSYKKTLKEYIKDV